MNFRRTARRIQRTLDTHQPLVEVSISRENLLHNLHTYQTLYPNLSFAPVLKSNAYGHGLTSIAELLDHESISFFMVDSYFEARTLRHADIHSRIVVMGYVHPYEIVHNALPKTDYAIVSIDQLREVVNPAQSSIRIHLKIDTGMHRQGVMPNDLSEALTLINSNKNLQLVGVCSHLADADNTDPTRSLQQIEVWNNAVHEVEKLFPNIEYKHIAATKGVPLSEKAEANVARIGIGLYGFDTSPDGKTDVKPVMQLRSFISSIREIQPGDFLGYNATYVAEKNMHVATIPVGYFEGVDRRLSNRGCMLVRGIECPIVGRVSMNISSIDVTNVPDVSAGDEVIVLSRNPSDTNSVSNIAKIVSTAEYTETPYVILTHIPAHLKRVVEYIV